jgi:hypothetical protein
VILLLIMLSVISSEQQVTVLMSTASMRKIQVEFSDRNVLEGRSVTRFVVADGPPQCEYNIFGKKSIHIFNNEQPYRTAPVRIGAPIKMKQCYLYPVIISPSYVEKNSHITYTSIEVTLQYTPVSRKLSISPSIKKVFEHLIVNLRDTEDSEPLGYLIITPNSFTDEVEPLAQWKEKKGWTVYVRTLSETGSSPSEIKNYIANAYLTWSPPPEYVLLIGDVSFIPSYSSAVPVSHTDYPYTLIDGDFFAELLIGRLPATTANELNTMVAKIIGYEQNPTLGEPSWYERSLMVAANHPPGQMTTPIPTKRWVRDRLFEYGFTTVDTVYYPPTSSGVPVTTSINQGVVFVNYRAGDADWWRWIYPSFENDDILGLNNGWKLPIVTSITCFTGNFGAEPCFGETWLRAGNPITPKGAVGFFGASAATTSSRWNNCLDHGIYWAFLKEDIYNLGPALYRGKMEVFMNFPDDTTWLSGSSFYFHTYNLLGDPSIDVWTDTPDTFIVTHDASIPVGTNNLSVQVNNSSSQPVAEAMISLFKDGEVKEVGFTNASGSVHFNFTTSSQDTLFVTVTKHNFKPYCGFCLVNNSATYVGYYDHTIDDSGGNNNGDVNPGEPIEMVVTLKNYGTSTPATDISAKLTTGDPVVTLTDSTATYANITPGGTATASPFAYSISTTVEHNHIIEFNLEISSSQGTWVSSIWITIQAPEFVYQRYQIPDGNGILEPGETNDVAISIKNVGGLIGSNITGILRSENTGVSVVDSIGSFGSIAIGDSSTNNSNRFRVTASSSLSPGHPIWFTTVLSGDNNFTDTVKFIITIGIIDQAKPLGSDGYGYFAYDDTDAGYDEQPTYEWVEIDPDLGGSGTILTLANDETKIVSLPFNFSFYGDSYNRVSISSNGYIAMDSTWVADMYNWAIPGAGGPPLLIAPFWDDLDPNATDSSGNVCYWLDSANHRFIVEYSRIQHIHDPTNPTPAELQTFEVILYDPAFYPTVTGDGEILFQYKDIDNDDQWHNYATVGIEDRNHTNGLEYTYANSYPDAAAPLVNNRAIKFTTDPPDTFPFPGSEENQTSPFNSEIPTFEIHPNPFKEKADIGYQISGMGNYTLNIYDVTGRKVKQFDNQTIRLSDHVTWDGTDDRGAHLPEGIYFAKLETDMYKIIRKIILIK